MSDQYLKKYLLSEDPEGKLYQSFVELIEAKKVQLVQRMDMVQTGDKLFIINGGMIFAADLLAEFESLKSGNKP